MLAALGGYAHFIWMVDADKGTPLLARVRAARAKWSGDVQAQAAVAGRAGGRFRTLAAQGKAPWPGFWQAGAPPAPVLEKTQEQAKAQRKVVNKRRSHASPDPLPGRPPMRSRRAANALPAAIPCSWVSAA